LNARANRKKSTKPAGTVAPDAVKGNPAELEAASEARVCGAPESSLRLPLFLSLASFIAVADQVLKAIIVRTLYLHDSIIVIPDFFSITRIHNNGIAFGLFQDKIPAIFMIITLISMLAVLYFYLTVSPRGLLMTVGCGSIIGGALGNLIDRFRLGYVVDFLDFSFWPAFNISDSAVSVGVFVLLVGFFRAEKGMAQDASRTAENRVD